MWIIILKSILALVSIFTGGAIFYKYIKDNKVLVFLAGTVSILSAVYLFIEIKKDIVKLNNIPTVKTVNNHIIETKVESRKEDIKEKVTSTSKWITPTDSMCKANGGKVDADSCKAEWEDAKKICSVSDGRLPTIEELKGVVVDCGGVIDNYSENPDNSDYQSCYKKKGFASYFYWSSTTVVGDEYGAWGVYFQGGYDDWYIKNNNYYVRCVRAGQ